MMFILISHRFYQGRNAKPSPAAASTFLAFTIMGTYVLFPFALFSLVDLPAEVA